jgi:hypothetical protein
MLAVAQEDLAVDHGAIGEALLGRRIERQDAHGLLQRERLLGAHPGLSSWVCGDASMICETCAPESENVTTVRGYLSALDIKIVSAHR